jgi:hypothetical protein
MAEVYGSRRVLERESPLVVSRGGDDPVEVAPPPQKVNTVFTRLEDLQKSFDEMQQELLKLKQSIESQPPIEIPSSITKDEAEELLAPIKKSLTGADEGLHARLSTVEGTTSEIPQIRELLESKEHGLEAIHAQLVGLAPIVHLAASAAPDMTLIRAWTKDILLTIDLPDTMRWSEPIITAFLIGRVAAGVAGHYHFPPDGGWRTHKRGGSNESNIYVVRYLCEEEGTLRGWQLSTLASADSGIKNWENANLETNMPGNSYTYRNNSQAIKPFQIELQRLAESAGSAKKLLIIASHATRVTDSPFGHVPAEKPAEDAAIYTSQPGNYDANHRAVVDRTIRYALTGSSGETDSYQYQYQHTAARYILWQPSLPAPTGTSPHYPGPSLQSIHIETAAS